MQTIQSTRIVLLRAAASGHRPSARVAPVAPLRAGGLASVACFAPAPVALRARGQESRRRKSVKVQAAAASNLTLPIDLRGACRGTSMAQAPCLAPLLRGRGARTPTFAALLLLRVSHLELESQWRQRVAPALGHWPGCSRAAS
jgi:hypothetical protein